MGTQTRGELAAQRIAGREHGREQRQHGKNSYDAQAEAGPAITRESCQKQWRHHGGLDYVTRDSTPRASG